MGALSSMSKSVTLVCWYISVFSAFGFGVLFLCAWLAEEFAMSEKWRKYRRFFLIMTVIGVAGEQLATLAEFILSEHLQTIFEVEVGPRRLTEGQSKALIELWHKYAGKDVEVSWNGTDESRYFEWQLEDVLKRAGLRLKPPTPSGIRESAGVALSGNWDDLDMMATIADSLNADGIVAIAFPHCGAIPNAPPGFAEPPCPFRIEVNAKPIGVLPLPPMPRKVYFHVLHEKPR